MIDLSHLTEEEQEMIMTVLRRDAELKKAEEERIRRLEKILSSGSQSDAKLKYLTGEWFYEAKSHRHTDKIHGSEIILASMKQGKAASLDGSLRVDRPKMSSSRSSDIVAPQKPARCFEALQRPETNEAENENQDTSVRSPRMPRHNPFNRASLIVVEPPESNHDSLTGRQQDSGDSEPVSPLNSPPARETSQTSGGFVTSEGSSAGFRPVPKKRTFLSRRNCGQPESCGPGPDARVGAAGVVPAPRRGLGQGSGGSSSQSSHQRSREEGPQRSAVAASDLISQPAQPSRPAEESSLQPLRGASQVSSKSSLERERPASSITSDRQAVYTKSDSSTKRNTQEQREDDRNQRGHAALNLISLPTSNIQDRENSSHVETAMMQEELSLPQSIVDPDPPMSYDLHYIDTSNQLLQKSSQVFKLSTQATSPTGDEEDSIAKVLDWFSRSVDSGEWLDSAEGPEGPGHSAVSRSRGDDFVSDKIGGMKERPEMKASHLRRRTEEEKEFRGISRKSSQGLIETKKEGERKFLQEEEEESVDENQPPKISHLKSFWEKSNAGPKILISKSVTPGDKGQKPAHRPADNEPALPSVPAARSEINTPDKNTSNHSDEREQQPSIGSGMRDACHPNIQPQADNLLIDSTPRRNNDLTYNSDYSKLRSSPENPERSPAIETFSATKRSPGGRRAESPESESVPASGPKPQPDGFFQQAEPPRAVPRSDSSTQSRGSLDSEKLSLPRSSSHMDHKQSVSDVPVATKAHVCWDSSGDRKRRGSEEKSAPPKAKEETPAKSRANSPHSNRQESTAERIKQLKSFWEQERNKPAFYTGKAKPSGDGRVARGASQAKLNKRFTKSEYDLRSMGNDSCSEEEGGSQNHPNFTNLPLNQRLEKVPPSLSTSRSQFNTLREFWDEATSDAKGSFSHDKPKSPKRKEPMGGQLPAGELRGGDAEMYRVSSPVDKTRPKSSPSPQIRSKSPHDRQPGFGSRAPIDGKNNLPGGDPGQQRPSRRSSKDSNREEKSGKPQSSPRKEVRSPKGRKDSFGGSSTRGSSLRRATSMFALSTPDEPDQSQLRIHVSPVHSQSRKQRPSADKAAAPRRSPEEALTPPRARAFVPTDYRHYLGMTDGSSVHASLAPAAKAEGPEGNRGNEPELGGPMRASTPVSGEERHSRRDCRAGQRPLWASYSSSDTGQESSLSSTSESWSTSRKNREKDDDPVRKALWRAETRPKNLAKSMEDITGGSSPRQERRPDPASELRRISDASSIPSPSSSLYSDPDHLKNISKSVPLFLQNEDDGRDTDSPSENGYYRRNPSMGSSMSNLTGSSSMMSVSSLSGSVMTMYGGDFGNVEVQGNIQFSINYVQRLREFHIFVAECRDLAAVEPKRARSDPYVKSYLVPDKANLGKRKTSVKKKTLNPSFNEILRYRVRMEYLRTQTLILSVWHHDTFGRNSFLGEVDVDLSKWDFDHTQMNYLALKARATPTLAPSNGRGEMKLSLRFLPQIARSEGKESPSSGEIHIWVKECKNLPLIRASIDPYVKCFVLPDTSRKSRQKTRVLRRTVDPVFNHTMVYDGIREADLTEACVELTVWDRDRLASNLLGGLRLGAGTGRSYGATVDWMDSSPYEVAMWERMLASPNEWVEGVLPLRMLNSAKTALK